MSVEWVCPTLTRTFKPDGTEGHPEIGGPLRGYDGEPYPRLFAESNVVDAAQCRATFWDARGHKFVCPLVHGHVGDHWQAQPELAAQVAPIAVWAELTDTGDV
jgi:hypothetical protein